MKKPIVAIVGRKNVGKSTLLNKIAGRRISIVEDIPGTTRDRITVEVSWQGRDFILVDTGGIELDESHPLSYEINRQIDIAIDEATLVIFMVNARDGILPEDEELADRLRCKEKPVILVANKADNARQEAGVAEFYRLGIGDPFPVSAYHGRNVADLLDKVVALLPDSEIRAWNTSNVVKVSIVGKPNVGKSTLLNTLVGEPRSIVTELPGTTRDTVDTLIDFKGNSVLLIDTAGIRKRGKIEPGIERYSVIRAQEAIERSDVSLVMFDASQPVSDQDTHVAGYVQKSYKGIILIGNKWDLTKIENRVEYSKYIKEQFRFIAYAPVLYISAKTGQGVGDILPRVLNVYSERMKRIPTHMLNDVVQEAIAVHPPPHKGGRQLKIMFATQAEINPPTFVFSVNDPELVHFSYQRYLENKLRGAFGFGGTPLKLVFKFRGE